MSQTYTNHIESLERGDRWNDRAYAKQKEILAELAATPEADQEKAAFDLFWEFNEMQGLGRVLATAAREGADAATVGKALIDLVNGWAAEIAAHNTPQDDEGREYEKEV